MTSTPLTVHTIGHSTRTIDALIEMLRAHGVTRLVDVRSIPRSRRNPQFNRDAMPKPLRAAGISYTHMPELGGLRKARRDSVNTAWRNDGFRGYADYMQTPEFDASVDALLEDARREPIAYMCAEAVPWRCHRSLLSDALVVRGVDVRHITSPTRAEPHKLTSFARVRGTRVTYPPEQSELQLSAPAPARRAQSPGARAPSPRKKSQRARALRARSKSRTKRSA
jgi:uncharacterized protein (DUF488 family)